MVVLVSYLELADVDLFKVRNNGVLVIHVNRTFVPQPDPPGMITN